MERHEISQSIHNKLIQKQIEEYKKLGYINIKADHIGYSNRTPKEISGHRPDISANNNGIRVICEVETDGSIETEHTREQWKSFSKNLYQFEVCVPLKSLSKAKKFAQRNGIKVDKFWPKFV
jgi:predicted TIM-barrel fold metal-dependent hydrolase